MLRLCFIVTDSSTLARKRVERRVNKYLSLCAEIEDTAARIYRQLAASSKIPGELKIILENLAHDEDDHAAPPRFALRFSSGSDFTLKSSDFAPAQALLKRAKELLEKTNQLNFDVGQAIEAGIELEQDFCRIHIDNSLEFKNDSLKKMFAALAQDDKIHNQKLFDAKTRFL